MTATPMMWGWWGVPAELATELITAARRGRGPQVLNRLLGRDRQRRRAMVSAIVVAEPVRCVECGICTYNCPLGIDVRSRARQGLPVADAYCLTCGECVARCPRGTLRLERSAVFEPSASREDPVR